MADRKTVAQELAAKDGQGWEKLSPEMVSVYLHNADLVIEERDRSPVDELNPKPVYTCDRCQDQAYIGGKRCLECNPIGLPVEEVHPSAYPTSLIIPQAIDGLTLGETAEVARNLIKANALTDDEKVCGIYLTGMNLKDYMARVLDGSIIFPVHQDTVVVESKPPFVAIEMSCGERVVYQTLEDMPVGSEPCTCGKPNHWFVFLEMPDELNSEGRGLPGWEAMINDGGEAIKDMAARFAAKAKKEAEEAAAKAKAALEAEEAKRTRPLKPNEYRCSKCSKPGKTIIHMLKKGGKGIGHKHQEFKIN